MRGCVLGTLFSLALGSAACDGGDDDQDCVTCTAADGSARDDAGDARPRDGGSEPRDAAAIDASVDAADAAHPSPCVGPFKIATLEDVAEIEDCVVIQGDLELVGNAVPQPQLRLPWLRWVTGSLTIGHSLLSNLRDVGLPALETVDGDLGVYPNAPFDLSLPALTTVAGHVTFEGPAMTSVELPSLATVGDLTVHSTNLTALRLPALDKAWAVRIDDNAALTAIELSVLTDAQQIGVSNDPSLGELALPALQELGTLSIAGTAVQTIELPSLEKVHELGISGNPTLARVDLPALNVVGHLWPDALEPGSLVVAANPVLSAIDAPALTEIRGNLGLSRNAALTELTLPALATVVDVIVLFETNLGRFALPALTTAGGLLATTNTSLTELQLPSLETIGMLDSFGSNELDIDHGELTIVDSALGSVDLPALTTIIRKLQIESNPLLSTLALPNLTKLYIENVGFSPRMLIGGQLSIVDNAMLPTCSAFALRDQLVEPVAKITIEDNLGPCP